MMKSADLFLAKRAHCENHSRLLKLVRLVLKCFREFSNREERPVQIYMSEMFYSLNYAPVQREPRQKHISAFQLANCLCMRLPMLICQTTALKDQTS